MTHGVLQNQDGWFGEGDDMIFIDGDTLPTINGTGTEDYYNGAWDFDGKAFANLRQGRALHRRPGADRRPLLPLPLAHRKPHHLREVDQGDHRARPRQRPRLTISTPSPTGIRPSPTPSSLPSRPPKPASQEL